MKKREVVEYIAFDGMVFKNPSDCEKYEERQKLKSDAEHKLFNVADEIIKIINDNEMQFKVSDDGDVILCFKEHFKDLSVSF